MPGRRGCGPPGTPRGARYLTSPTFGGSSWLAHATLQSGLPVSDQGRYDQLLASDRTTLTSAFARAGWRTVAVLPSTRGTWPEGQAFYGFDRVYGRAGLGYAGPRFGFSAMPDQYALSAFAAAGARRAATAIRSWPRSSSPRATGPGRRSRRRSTRRRSATGRSSTASGRMPSTARELWSDRADVPAAYRTSIRYSLTSVLSFVEPHGDDDLVVVLLGDHQPSTVVSGVRGNRDVPVTVIAPRPGGGRAVSGWGWQDGLRPDDARAGVAHGCLP